MTRRVWAERFATVLLTVSVGTMVHSMTLPEPAPVPSQTAPSESPEVPDYDTDTLECGFGAGVAVDYNDTGWWAYCEPAMID